MAKSPQGAPAGHRLEDSRLPVTFSGPAGGNVPSGAKPLEGALEARGVACARAEDWLPTVADGSVQLLILDPPYFRVVSEAWDRQWKTAAAYLDWLGSLADEWRRVLAPNGSLYVFASPEMAARVEVLVIGERFEVLNSITWAKPGVGREGMAGKDDLRAYFPETERVVFAGQRGADENANDASGYREACRSAARRTFGDRIRAGRIRLGMSAKGLAEVIGAHGAINHGGAVSNWEAGFNVPTPEYFQKLLEAGVVDRALGDLGAEYRVLRAGLEAERRIFQDLRRPFAVTADVPHTDVWTYPTVEPGPGRHPCEKPLPMLRDIIRASSRPGDLVVDCFSGSGSTWAAAIDTGREFAGCEMDSSWCRLAEDRAERHLSIRERRPVNGKRPAGVVSGPLFGGHP